MLDAVLLLRTSSDFYQCSHICTPVQVTQGQQALKTPSVDASYSILLCHLCTKFLNERTTTPTRYDGTRDVCLLLQMFPITACNVVGYGVAMVGDFISASISLPHYLMPGTSRNDFILKCTFLDKKLWIFYDSGLCFFHVSEKKCGSIITHLTKPPKRLLNEMKLGWWRWGQRKENLVTLRVN